MGGHLLVGVGHSVKLVLNEHLVQRVEEDLLGEASGFALTSATTNNLGGSADILEDGLVHSLEGARSGALLARVSDLSLGVNGSVDDDDDGPLELLLEVFDDGAGDLLEELERSEGDLDEDVLLGAAISRLVRLFGHGVDENNAELSLDVLVGLLKGGKALGGVLLELGGLDLLAQKRNS